MAVQNGYWTLSHQLRFTGNQTICRDNIVKFKFSGEYAVPFSSCSSWFLHYVFCFYCIIIHIYTYDIFVMKTTVNKYHYFERHTHTYTQTPIYIHFALFLILYKEVLQIRSNRRQGHVIIGNNPKTGNENDRKRTPISVDCNRRPVQSIIVQLPVTNTWSPQNIQDICIWSGHMVWHLLV